MLPRRTARSTTLIFALALATAVALAPVRTTCQPGPAAPAAQQDQTSPQRTGPALPTPTFDVATIKPTDETSGVMHSLTPQVFPGGRIVINAHSLKGLISIAFHTGFWQISGGDDWIDKTRFDLEAKPSEEWQQKITNITHSNDSIADENIRRMLQALLIDRFQLKVHRETKTGKVYLLEQGTNRTKLQTSKVTATHHPGVPEGYSGEVGWNGVYNTSMSQLAKSISDAFQQPVIDRTGLQGWFDYKRKVSLPFPQAQEDGIVNRQDVQDNLQQLIGEMGLKLTPSTGPMETLVIDHAEKPSEN